MTSSTPSDRLATIRALNDRYVACRTCDAVFERPVLDEGQRARCPVCHSQIIARKPRHSERTLALMLASLIVYLVAVLYPFMRMERSGLSNQISVVDAVNVLWDSQMEVLAVVTGFLILLFPLTRVLLLTLLAGAMHFEASTGHWHTRIARLAQVLEPWSMVDIFMIGVLVSLVKIGSLARIEVGPAFWGMSALVVFLAMGATAACRDSTWRYLRDQF